MGKVLLVNDSKFESMVMKDMLASMEYNVKVTDEFSIMQQVRVFSPDYVIVNFVMKEIRGDQLIAMIKLQNPGIKCILSSSNSISMQEFRFKKIDAVFQTPIETGMLRQILDSLGQNSDSQLSVQDF